MHLKACSIYMGFEQCLADGPGLAREDFSRMVKFGLVLLTWQIGGACVAAHCPFCTVQKHTAYKQLL